MYGQVAVILLRVSERLTTDRAGLAVLNFYSENSESGGKFMALTPTYIMLQQNKFLRNYTRILFVRCLLHKCY